MTSKFVKYQHLERFGTPEVDGIEFGDCYIFPKIDGTNGVVWYDQFTKTVKAGSRNRELSAENDNQNFFKMITADENIKKFFEQYPHYILYGEYMVPHSLKTYRDDVWHKFYVFDVCETVLYESTGFTFHLPYEHYKFMLDEFNIEYIPPLAIIGNPTYESLIKQLEKNTYLIQDGKGTGEGIVIKNYGFRNQYGRTTWAKIVTSEFKEKHIKEMGAPVVKPKEMTEIKIVDDYATTAFIQKECAKFIGEQEWDKKMISHLFQHVFNTLIAEEIANILKEFKLPKIDFKTLNSLVIMKIKKTMPELFE